MWNPWSIEAYCERKIHMNKMVYEMVDLVEIPTVYSSTIAGSSKNNYRIKNKNLWRQKMKIK